MSDSALEVIVCVVEEATSKQRREVVLADVVSITNDDNAKDEKSDEERHGISLNTLLYNDKK